MTPKETLRWTCPVQNPVLQDTPLTYIGFCNIVPSESHPLPLKVLSKVLKKNYQHCFVLQWDGFRWIKYDQTFEGVKVVPIYEYPLFDKMVFPEDGIQFNLAEYYNNTQQGVEFVQVFPMQYQLLQQGQISLLNNCVGFCKSMTWDRMGWTFETPYSYYKRLKRDLNK